MFTMKRIKHVTIMVKNRDAATERFRQVFDFGDARPGVMERFGLINDHFPVGDSFVEVLEVVDPQKAGGRFLERFGPGFYMLIFEIEDQPAAVEHLEAMDARLTLKGGIGPDYRNIHLHPSSNLGPLLGLGDPHGKNPWAPGGADWETHRRNTVVKMFREVAIVTDDLDRMAGRYQRYFGITPTRFERLPDGGQSAWVPIGDTVLQYIQPGTGASAAAHHLRTRGPGMFEVRVQVQQLDMAASRAADAGVTTSETIEGDGFRAALLDPDAMFGARWVIVETEGDWPAEGITLAGGHA